MAGGAMPHPAAASSAAKCALPTLFAAIACDLDVVEG
jgi:hypothetical protein